MRSLVDILLERKMVSSSLLESASEHASSAGVSTASVLISRGIVSEEDILKCSSELYGYDFVSLASFPVQEKALKAIPAKFALHYGVMPLELDGTSIKIAVSDPLSLEAVEDIEANFQLRVDRVLSCQSDIADALSKYYGIGAETVERILAEASQGEETEDQERSHDLEFGTDEASVVRLVNQLLHEAINDRATDIHFEVDRESVSVRRRIDGILYETSIPADLKVLYPSIVSRVKLMSNLNIVERRLPQDGRARVRIGGAQYDLRISIVPAVHGEDIVIRILPASMLFDLEHLGYSPEHREMLEKGITSPHGVVFVTGPTGSGKSTTLYACLSRLNSRKSKIITIEDPVEYELKGLTQTQINPKIGLTFSTALRSMLRHDPDVMMVGEVRDRETAEIAIQTAMTGHLVLSTLHTNDAAGAAVRLIDMGIDPYLIASTVSLFIAQRLVRVICPECRTEVEGGDDRHFTGAGCKACNGSGYRGRVAISEFIPLVPEIQKVILSRSSSAEIRKTADSLGMRTLAQDGMLKVASGVTTKEELLRVTSI